MAKIIEDLNSDQQKILELLKQTKEIKEITSSDKSSTYADISEEAIFNALHKKKLLTTDHNWRFRNKR